MKEAIRHLKSINVKLLRSYLCVLLSPIIIIITIATIIAEFLYSFLEHMRVYKQ